jgi:hypothetical protein
VIQANGVILLVSPSTGKTCLGEYTLILLMELLVFAVTPIKGKNNIGSEHQTY